jgi:membrane protein YqaA with SNARE-associated domain
VVNCSIGRYAATWRARIPFPDDAKLERACRWGIWCLLLSRVPVIGDLLTPVAGVLRTAFVPFMLLVLVGKAARYVAIVLVSLETSRSLPTRL